MILHIFAYFHHFPFSYEKSVQQQFLISLKKVHAFLQEFFFIRNQYWIFKLRNFKYLLKSTKLDQIFFFKILADFQAKKLFYPSFFETKIDDNFEQKRKENWSGYFWCNIIWHISSKNRPRKLIQRLWI